VIVIAIADALKNAFSDIAKRVMETRPWLAKLPSRYGRTPMHHAVVCDQVGVLRVLLEHDSSLGYIVAGTEDVPLLVSAAFHGHIGIAREILNYCPDAPFRCKNGWTCLNTAVEADRLEFVKFVLRTPELKKLVSMRDEQGKTALHYAVRKCNPKMVAALLSHGGTDITMLDNNCSPPSLQLWGLGDHTKTLNWVCYYNLHSQLYLFLQYHLRLKL
jgi:ankyrin repeat protein